MINFKYIHVLIIIFNLVTKESIGQFVALNDDQDNDFNFSVILAENNKVEAFLDICPLKILGGQEINIAEIPYQVAVRRKISHGSIWSAYCGGSLITMSHIITAAHCFVDSAGYLKDLSTRIVVAGTMRTKTAMFDSTPDEQWRRIKNIYKHQFYNKTKLEHDFAIIEVSSAFVPSSKVKPIRLHNLKRDRDVGTGELCSVSGFGLLEKSKSAQRLNSVCVKIISMAECSSYYPKKYLHPSSLCAGFEGKDSCQGDSGGPLVCNGVLVGLVAWGGECGFQPGVYTRISTYTTDKDIPLLKCKSVVKSNYPELYIISVLLIFT